MKTWLAALVVLASFSALASDVLGGAKQQVRTGAKNDVQVQLSDSAGVNLAAVLANNTALANGLQVLMLNVETSAPSYSAGSAAMPWGDTAGRQIVATNSNSLSSNVAQVNGAALSATNPVFVQLSNGAATYTGPASTQLPASLGQTTMANSLPVTLASNQGNVSVTTGYPTGFATAVGTQATIASAGTTAIACASSLATTTPTKLFRVRVTGAAMMRCTARYNNNGAFTNAGVLMLSPATPNAEINFGSQAPAAVTTGSTGSQQWEVNCNNFDAASQDVNVDCGYCIGASGC
jgi:hypothetical protein